MKLITSLIDQAIDESPIGDYNHVFHGLSELVMRAEQPMPVTIPDRKQVALDDKVDLITWMRLEGAMATVENELLSFGRNKAVQQTATIRLVIAHKAHLGEDVITEFIAALPRRMKNKNFKALFIDEAGTVDTDHQTIYTTEFGQTSYERHRLSWNLYALALSVQFIPC